MQDLPINHKHDIAIDNEYKKILADLNLQSSDNNQSGVNTSINDILNRNITGEEIDFAINKQETVGKAADFNGIHPFMLKKLGVIAQENLKTLFNLVLNSGSWVWSVSVVTFIKKLAKKSYAKPDSYRPISVAAYIGKILERILDRRLRGQGGSSPWHGQN